MKRSTALLIYAAPIVLPAGLFLSVLAAGSPMFRTAIPSEPRETARCTWYCHNHGCPHRAVLPSALTGDAGLFGRTIHGLFALGSQLSGRRDVGYGSANLLVFCVLWPGLMYVLAVVAIRQRLALRARRARGRA
ncbi:MAG: hypothetical protein HOO96_29920 [Polyangiaceae bacterium]|nr:hypothetical protein [Polyangiaceae bacterium]